MFSLKQFNASMKQKPKEVRALYAFWSAAVVTVVLSLIWLVTIPTTLERIASTQDEEVSRTGNFSNVLRSLRASVSDSVDSFRSVTEEIDQPATDVAATPAPNTIDFSTFFEASSSEAVVSNEPPEAVAPTSSQAVEGDVVITATTSLPSTTPVEPAPRVPRQVLIGTTSARTSTGTPSE